MGGLLHHARAAAAFSTPTLNGYRRFRPYSLAPDRAIWGMDNRGVMLWLLLGADAAISLSHRVNAAPGAFEPMLATLADAALRPLLAARFGALSAAPVGAGPAELDALQASDRARWIAVIRRLNLTLTD
jgi:hypothetical protein